MEESISSSSRSRTAGASFFYRDVHCCYPSVDGPRAAAEASEDSGWTAYFYDDEDGDRYLQLQASQEEPAAPALPAPRKKKKANRHGHGHGDRASTSTVSTASKAKARKKKEVPKEEKKRPRWESADEDPLQDTASSMPANATPQLQLQDGWQIAGCYDQQRSSDTALQWIPPGDAHGLPGQATRCREEGIASCLISPS